MFVIYNERVEHKLTFHCLVINLKSAGNLKHLRDTIIKERE